MEISCYAQHRSLFKCSVCWKMYDSGCVISYFILVHKSLLINMAKYDCEMYEYKNKHKFHRKSKLKMHFIKIITILHATVARINTKR